MVEIAAFDRESGTMLWQKKHQAEKPTLADLRSPVRFFTAEKDALTYSIANELWNVGTADGRPLPRSIKAAEAAHSY